MFLLIRKFKRCLCQETGIYRSVLWQCEIAVPMHNSFPSVTNDGLFVFDQRIWYSQEWTKVSTSASIKRLNLLVCCNVTPWKRLSDWSYIGLYLFNLVLSDCIVIPRLKCYMQGVIKVSPIRLIHTLKPMHINSYKPIPICMVMLLLWFCDHYRC